MKTGVGTKNRGKSPQPAPWWCYNAGPLTVKLKRTVFLVFGAMGVYAYLGHLAWQFFKDSVFFPLVLALLGLSLFLGTVWGPRYWRRRLSAA